MNLDKAQIQQVAAWIEEGRKLGDIQKKLASELGVRMTYMEVRFLMDDLKLKPKEPEPAVVVAPPEPEKGMPDAAVSAGPSEEISTPGAKVAPAVAGVLVTVDAVTRPGSLVSGKVTFSDGIVAEWYLDQTGRIGLAPPQPGYRPTQEDLLSFQSELQNQLAQLGF